MGRPCRGGRAKVAGSSDQSASAWAKGSGGERRLASFLERQLAGYPVVFLHDRLIPGPKTNIDHLIVAPAGVWIVDAKSYKGKLERRDAGPLWWADYRVYVGGRDRSKLTDGLAVQVAAVRAALEPDATDATGSRCGSGCFCGSRSNVDPSREAAFGGRGSVVRRLSRAFFPSGRHRLP